jgi:Flp pilus assembly pilin Flp
MTSLTPAAPRRAPLRRFLRSDEGAVTADYVVLLAMAASLALVTVGALMVTTRSMTGAVGTGMSANDSVSDSWAVAMRSYQPIKPERYEAMYNDMASLRSADLAMLAAMVADSKPTYRVQIMAGGSNEPRMMTDLEYAIGRAYADRLARTPVAGGHDEAEVARILAALGWRQIGNGRFRFPYHVQHEEDD